MARVLSNGETDHDDATNERRGKDGTNVVNTTNINADHGETDISVKREHQQQR